MVEAIQVLLIEDDPVLGPSMLQRLRLEGFLPRLAETGESALKEIRRNPPDMIVSDIKLPDMTGEDVFREMLATGGLLPIYFVTAFGEVDQAVRLMKAGARDYLTKPVDVDALVDALRAIAAGHAKADAPAGAVEMTGASAAPAADPVVAQAGGSDVMRQVEATLAKFARTDLPALLRGETGVGKEVAARRLHALGRPANAPFVAVNCAAIPGDLMESTLFGHEKGAFTGADARRVGLAEQAADGVLFLDEIAELSTDLQAKLLRLIQERTFLPLGASAERPFQGRVVAATHADLEARIADGRFREDLYYRINVLEVTVPPLRARTEDVPALAETLLAEANGRTEGPPKRLSSEATAALIGHDWPGNVRELRNRIERATVLAEGEALDADDLFPEGRLDAPKLDSMAAGALGDAAREAVRDRVVAALRQTGGNQSEAARLLGVSRTTVWKYAR